MKMNWNWKNAFVVSLVSLALASVSVTAQAANDNDPDPHFDRLDGTGATGAKVDVIEWEGNLEVHVYPKGKIRGLSFKLDKKNKNKPVMVIAYRFTPVMTERLIRRAILSIPMNEGFKVYKDPTADDDYDKFIVSNNGLSAPMIAFKTDPQPEQLYPTDPLPGEKGEKKSQTASNDSPSAREREPAQHQKQGSQEKAHRQIVDEDGGIQPFFMSREPRGAR